MEDYFLPTSWAQGNYGHLPQSLLTSQQPTHHFETDILYLRGDSTYPACEVSLSVLKIGVLNGFLRTCDPWWGSKL